MSMINEFKINVLKGLQSFPKYLPSKYFYDAQGDRLFQRIMGLPEYYLTRCEYSILKKYQNELLDTFSSSGSIEFDLIELGAGDGTKTKLLLQHFLEEKARFNYIPIDISPGILTELKNSLQKSFPQLRVKEVAMEYFEALKQINDYNGHRRKVIFFLGSNIGNFNEKSKNDFLIKLSDALKPGDMVLIGFDLKKDPKIIRKAYDDDAGITKEFNLNLLQRINHDLSANFNINEFQHYASYNPQTGTAESFLISKKKQEVDIFNVKITFQPWESIHMEISQKYDERMLQQMAKTAGFDIITNFFDEDHYFVDALWQKKD